MGRPVPKYSGLFCKIDVLTETAKRKKFSADEQLWIEVLCKSEHYKNLSEENARQQLANEGIAPHVIEAFLASRKNLSYQAVQ